MMQFLKLGVILGKKFNFVEPKSLFYNKNKNEANTQLIYDKNEMK